MKTIACLLLVVLNCFILFSQTNTITYPKVGEKFRDFSAETIDGEKVNISDSIKNKMAIIHFWSPWCHSSRNAGREMIPIYEKYKQNGLVIISTANVKDSTIFRTALSEDKTPWLNLVDINNKNNVWSIYGLMAWDGSEGGGGGYLIDERGYIIAYANSTKKLNKILSKKYKKN